MMRRKTPDKLRRSIPALLRQSGAALIVGLIFLILMTMIGLGAVQTSTLQERMAGNLRDRGLAYLAAETALRDAEVRLTSGSASAPTVFKGVAGLYDIDQSGAAADSDLTANFMTAAQSAPSAAVTVPGVATQPRYIIEKQPNLPGPTDPDGLTNDDKSLASFRVTAYGVGATNDAAVVLQSVLVIPK